jgi:hypothetical protein
VYVAFNGPQYPGSGPNKIKEFRPQAPSGVNAWDENRLVDVFPNPAQDLVTFRVGNAWCGASYEIVNLQGRVVDAGLLGTQAVLDVSQWVAGTYLLKAVHPERNGQLSRILVVE